VPGEDFMEDYDIPKKFMEEDFLSVKEVKEVNKKLIKQLMQGFKEAQDGEWNLFADEKKNNDRQPCERS